MNRRILQFALAALTFAAFQPARSDGLLAIVNPAERAVPVDNCAITASGQFFSASDYTAMRYFSDDRWTQYAPRDGRNVALAFARLDASARSKSWSLGYFYRLDALLESNHDLIEIVGANKMRTIVSTNRTFNIDLDLQGFEADGVRLDKAFSWQTGSAAEMTVGAGVSLLRGRRTRMIQGQGSALSTGSGYFYALGAEDADNRKSFPFMAPGEVSGTGYAFDLGLRVQWTDGRRLDLAVNDLMGEIRWKNLPRTTETANSAIATRDAEGYIAFNPTLSGQNSRVDLTQRLDPKGSLHFHAPLGHGLSANLGTEWIKSNVFPGVGLEFATTNGITLALDYDIRFNSYGLGVTWNNLYLAARTENMNLDQSKAYGIEAGLGMKF